MDRLIKEKLEAYHPEFTETAWLEFAPHLSKGFWWKSWWGISSVSGILLFVVYLLYPVLTQELPDKKLQLVENQSSPIPSPLVEEPNAVPSVADSLEKEAESNKAEYSNPGILKKTDGKRLDSNSIPFKSENRKVYMAVENKEAIPAYLNEENLKWKSKNYQSQNVLSYHYSDPELMRHLFEMDTVDLNHPSTTVSGTGDIYKIKEPLHWDVTIGPVMRWVYPVDGFSTTRMPYSEELFSWRFPGLGMALVLYQKWVISAGIMRSSTVNYISVGEGYPIEKLSHFPDWSAVTFPVDHIKIKSRQLLIPLSFQYRQKVKGDFGIHFKVGMIAHHIGRQNFYYEKPIFASSLGFSTSHFQNTWQLSYLQGGLGVDYRLSKRFSTYLESEFWKGIQPAGGEKHRYTLMGISFGVNYHLFPKK